MGVCFVSIYNLNKIFFLLDIDAEFLAKLRQSPEIAIEQFALEPTEREALLTGNIGSLYKMGVHTFLLTATVRHNLLGVTRDRYERDIKSAI